MIRALLADDHALVREGMKKLIAFYEDITIAAEASCGDEVLRMLAAESFDILLLDITMPGISGADLITAIRAGSHPPPILVLTMHNEPRLAKLNLQAGASGFLTKDCPPDMLEEAIRKVAAGGRYIQPDIAASMIIDLPAEPTSLSPQEMRILKLFAKGHRVVDIAQDLGLSSRTISTHKMRLMQKLGIDKDADLIRYADSVY